MSYDDTGDNLESLIPNAIVPLMRRKVAYMAKVRSAGKIKKLNELKN